MASTGGKQKRKVWFVLGNGSFTTMPTAPGDRKVPSPWNPGKSRNKFK